MATVKSSATPPADPSPESPDIPDNVKGTLKGIVRETLDEWLSENTPKSRSGEKPAEETGDSTPEFADTAFGRFMFGKGK